MLFLFLCVWFFGGLVCFVVWFFEFFVVCFVLFVVIFCFVLFCCLCGCSSVVLWKCKDYFIDVYMIRVSILFDQTYILTYYVLSQE